MATKLKVVPCNSLWSKARGLMFSKKKDLLFIFKSEQYISLHMLFVFFPIWAIYLDKDKTVTKIKKLNPFVSSVRGKAKYILELTEKSNLKIGDQVDR